MPDSTATAVQSRPQPHPRHVGLRILGLWIAMVAAFVGVSAVPSHAAVEHHPAVVQKALAGTWDLTVTIQAPSGATTTTARFVFHPDHKLTGDGGGLGDDGKPLFQATGFWNEGKNGAFSMYVTHPGAADGAIIGTVRAIHLGQIRGTHFSTRAYAQVYDGADVNIAGPIAVSSVATWVSSSTS
ncbi:hypothetical protein ACFXJ5_15975 [Streptomyces sp. NPDC059373]